MVVPVGRKCQWVFRDMKIQKLLGPQVSGGVWTLYCAVLLLLRDLGVYEIQCELRLWSNALTQAPSSSLC